MLLCSIIIITFICVNVYKPMLGIKSFKSVYLKLLLNALLPCFCVE